MQRKTLVTISLALIAAGFSGNALAQTPAPAQPPAAQAPAPAPMFATTKVEGTENVYVFRYQNHQSMFVVTPAGVIVTDPISYGRPQAAKTYLEEIRKITQAPIKYLIYSHHHYDHAAGGKVFKDAGARRDRAPARQGTARRIEISRRRHARPGRGRQAHDPAWRHRA
jgi:glyoxylase-like metal-dependent hydrolase (beta-lactamase superfamily II)